MRIFRFLKPYILFVILAPLAMVGEVLMDLELPMVMRDIVNLGVLGSQSDIFEATGIAYTNLEYILVNALKMLGMLALGGVFGILSGVFASIAANSFGDDVRRSVFAATVDLSYEQKDMFSTGSLITRITNDITAVQNMISMLIRMCVRTLMLFIGGIIMMLSINKIFLYILLVVLPIEILFIPFFLKKATPYFSKIQKKYDKVNSIVQENVNGVRVVKAYTKEEHESERFNEASVDLSITVMKVMKLLAIVMPIIMILMNAAVVAIIYIGGIEVDRNSEFNSGDVMAAITFITQILSSVMMIAMMGQNISRGAASIKRINEVLDTKRIINDGGIINSTNEGTVEFCNVSFSYPSNKDKNVISNFTLKINKGEKIALLGATGSGKTSIVNLIGRLYDVNEGVVKVDGIDVREYDVDTLRKKIGYILQKTELFSGTILENIKWGNEDASLDDVIKASKIAMADDFISSYKDKYNTMIAEKGASLSGGQKQRISIARCLVKKPEIIIFDDSTSALDLKTEANIHKALKENINDVTMIVIAQRVASAKNCDKICVIDEGKLVSYGTHDELMKTSKVYQDIYKSQLKRGENDE